MTHSNMPAGLLDLHVLAQAAECLRTLAHPHRLRMVQMLLRGKFTVGELADACEIPSHMASEHLRLMQRCGLLAAERDGRCMYYQIAEPHLAQIMHCIESRFGAAEGRAAASDSPLPSGAASVSDTLAPGD